MADPKPPEDGWVDVPESEWQDVPDAGFEDAGGNVPTQAAAAPSDSSELLRRLGSPSNPQSSFSRAGEESFSTGLHQLQPDTPQMVNVPKLDEITARDALVTGVPLGASLLLGPEAGVPAHALMQMALAGPTFLAGEVLNPAKDQEERKRRVLETIALPVAGELGGGVAIDAVQSAGRALYPVAERQGLRALGFLSDKLSRLGGTGLEALQRGQQISRSSLDNDVLRFFGNSRGTAQRALGIADETGARLQAARQAIDAAAPGVDGQRIYNELVSQLQNWRPGRSAEPVLQGQLDDALVDLMAHSNSSGRLGMQDLSDLKGVYDEGARFHATPESMASSRGADVANRYRSARGTAQGFEEAHAAQNMGPEDFEQFLGDKSLHGDMQELIGPHGALGKRVVKDATLSQAGLLPTVMAAGAGSPAGQVATLVGARTASQYGNQMMAVLADRVAKGLLDPQTAQLILAASQISAQQAPTEGIASGLGLAP